MLEKEKIGKRIAFYRKEKGITQKELAEFLHISYQAVSKWESGKSMPTVEMLYEISKLLNVTVDTLLNENEWKSRRITYRDSGLDSERLHALKKDIQKLNTRDDCILSANYADTCLFQIDTSQMKEPVYSCITCVPGSKEKLAKEYRYNQEICADVAANAINYTLQYGEKPVLLKAMLICGNYSQEQLYLMAQAFQRICDKNKVLFTGMEISAQPVNYTTEEYVVSAMVLGAQDKDKVLTGSRLREGDVLIGIKTEGIDGTNYPIVKVMLDKRPELYRAEIEENKFFIDELMRANTAFTREITALQEKGYLHKAFRMANALLNRKSWVGVPEGLGVCIDLSAVPVMSLYQFLFAQDMIGEDVFASHFNMGIGMVAAVPEKYREEAMEVIGQFSKCWCIGRVEANHNRKGEKFWSRGRILWQE
ncbi:MAG: helix-turn-helix domain-containing protein [Lachnospiraceae bacterium]|nr:helix-turn-helix domain-containing protein [Lachnospiraceae bacterium]